MTEQNCFLRELITNINRGKCNNLPLKPDIIPQIPPETTHFEFIGNGLETLTNTSLKNAENLIYLNLGRNQIKKISQTTFDALSHLRNIFEIFGFFYILALLPLNFIKREKFETSKKEYSGWTTTRSAPYPTIYFTSVRTSSKLIWPQINSSMFSTFYSPTWSISSSYFFRIMNCDLFTGFIFNAFVFKLITGGVVKILAQ